MAGEGGVQNGPPAPPLTQLAVADAHVALQQVVHPAGSFFLQRAGLGDRIPSWWVSGGGGTAQGPPHSPRAHRCTVQGSPRGTGMLIPPPGTV